eukprot:520312_1
MANAFLQETTGGKAHPEAASLKRWINENNLPHDIYNALVEMDLDLHTLLLSEEGTNKQLPTISQICDDLQQTLGEEIFNMTAQLQFIESLQKYTNHENDNLSITSNKRYKITAQEQNLLNQLNGQYNLYLLKLKSVPLSLQWLKQEQVTTHDYINQMYIILQNKLNEKQELFDEYITNIYHDFEQSLIKKYRQKLDNIKKIKDQCNKLWPENIQSETTSILMQNILQNMHKNEYETAGNNNPFEDYKKQQEIIQSDMLQSMHKILKFDNKKHIQNIHINSDTLSHKLLQTNAPPMHNMQSIPSSSSPIASTDKNINKNGKLKNGNMTRQRLIDFYKIYNPQKLNDREAIEEVLRRYKGRETKLFNDLNRKYNVP